MRIKYLPQDNEARINNGICRYKGRPYLIGLVTQTELMLSPIYRKEGPGSESFKVDVGDTDLDISALQLGFVNSARGLYYLSRRPERRYKQTLAASGALCFPPGDNRNYVDHDITHAVLHSAAGERMLMDDYPTLERAIEDLRNNKVSGIAFGREVAINYNSKATEWNVLVKNEKVGTLDLTNVIVKLIDSEYKWISERYLSRYPWRIE